MKTFPADTNAHKIADSLPIGSVVRTPGGRQYARVVEGLWLYSEDARSPWAIGVPSKLLFKEWYGRREYEVLIEGDGEWRLTVEPDPDVRLAPLEGLKWSQIDSETEPPPAGVRAVRASSYRSRPSRSDP